MHSVLVVVKWSLFPRLSDLTEQSIDEKSNYQVLPSENFSANGRETCNGRPTIDIIP